MELFQKQKALKKAYKKEELNNEYIISTEERNSIIKNRRFEDYYYISFDEGESGGEYCASINKTPDGKYKAHVTGERGVVTLNKTYDAIEEANYELITTMQLYVSGMKRASFPGIYYYQTKNVGKKT